MYLVYEALISVYGSARQVEAELAHRVVWKVMRRVVKRQFPDDLKMRLPPGRCGGTTTSTGGIATSPALPC
jgi:hypothetical protein